MNSDRRAILALVAMGRITPAEAERLLAVWNEGRETVWIIVLGLTFTFLAHLHLHELLTTLLHFFNAQVPTLAETLHRTATQIAGLIGGLQ